MEMSNKKQQIPAIRFNGFTDTWEQRKFSNIVNRVSKQSNDSNLPKVEFEDIVSGEGRLNKDISRKFDDRKGIVFEPNFILFGKLRPYLKNWLFPNFKGIALGDFWVFEPNDSSSIFNYYLIQSNKYQTVANLSSGTKMPRSDWKTVSETEFSIPANIEEQTKIGSFFKQLDNTIALHQRQLDNYKELQKSLLQKIFNQELRFKDKYGDDYPEWEKEKLGNLITEVVEKSTIQDQYPILSSTNKGLFLQSEYFKSNIASDDNIGYKILRQNEIVFSPQNLWMGNINFNDKYEAGIVSPSYKIFSVNDGIVHEFMKFMIKTQYMMNEYVLSSEQGASIVRRNLDMELFNKIKVKIPTIPEQKKITDFLIASDDQIDQVAQKLERLKEQKKGLMQRMFV